MLGSNEVMRIMATGSGTYLANEPLHDIHDILSSVGIPALLSSDAVVQDVVEGVGHLEAKVFARLAVQDRDLVVCRDGLRKSFQHGSLDHSSPCVARLENPDVHTHVGLQSFAQICRPAESTDKNDGFDFRLARGLLVGDQLQDLEHDAIEDAKDIGGAYIPPGPSDVQISVV